MPKISAKNLVIVLGMAVVGFYSTSWLVKNLGD